MFPRREPIHFRKVTFLVGADESCSELPGNSTQKWLGRVVLGYNIMQYRSTVYLEMMQVVSGQFQHIENIKRGNTAVTSQKDIKLELSYTLISAFHSWSVWET